MTSKSRLRFTIAGTHPLLLLSRDYLILTGRYELVPWDQSPDVCLYGGVLCKGDKLYNRLAPLQADYHAMKHVPLVVLTGTPSSASKKELYSTLVLSVMLGSPKNSSITLPVVYGPNIHTGVIHKFLQQHKRKDSITIYGNGHQNVACVHEEDYLKALSTKIPELLNKPQSTYLWGTQSITISGLAKTIDEDKNFMYKNQPIANKVLTGPATLVDSRSIRAGVLENV